MVAGVTEHALPSGDQHEIRHGAQRAVVVEVGGGLRVYETADGPVLDGYEASERCGGGRGQPLMPWPNRLRDGRYEWAGSTQQLPLTEPETGTAIHGLVRWANWSVLERAEASIAMGYRLYPQPGWPGTLDLRIEYRLDDAGLTVTTTALNAGSGPCPFGAGFHPYIGMGVDRVDGLEMQVPAHRRLQSDERGLPTGWTPVAGGASDYRQRRLIDSAQLDDCFTDLERGEDGLARVAIAAAGRPATVWLDRAFEYVMVFTGDTLPASSRRRGLAVEPMSCPPDALRSGEGLVTLGPGDAFTGRWGISTR
jgi:aldose 1-epimerase